MAPQTWFITGCSTGFGLEFVYNLLARGDNVIATARNPASISHLREAGAHVMALDITSSQEVLDGVVREAVGVFGGVDVLVNNAAYCVFGVLEDVRSEQWEAQYKTNVFGTINITRSFLPHFRAKKAGVVVFIGSMAGWSGRPVAGPYCSSKFALEGVVESFQRETSHLGIKSINIEPGYFRTHLLAPSNSNSILTSIPDYTEIVQNATEGFKAYDRKQPGDPKKAVDIIIDVVKGEGKAKGKGFPERLALGRDAVAQLREKCEDTLKLLKEWEDVSCSTDFAEGE